METKTSGVKILDTDALLPPRKRLLAGLKRQNSDSDPPPIPFTCNNLENNNDSHVLNLLKSQLSNPNLSTEDIVESSRRAAIEAAKLAEAARSKAEQKAAIAANAMLNAKTALDLVDSLTKKAAKKEKFRLRISKMKKHVTLEKKPSAGCRKDEELARVLHQTINSSPRITRKELDSSDINPQKRKRAKSSDSPKTLEGDDRTCNSAEHPRHSLFVSQDKNHGITENC